MAAPATSTRTRLAPQAMRQVRQQPVVTDPVILLSALIALLALVATLVGLFWQDGSGQFPFRTVRGVTVQMFGQGIYRYDTLLQGAINRGADAVILVLGIPLLAGSSLLYRRGSFEGRLLLTTIFAFFLYVYASMALGAAYNDLFLIYVTLFSASLFAFIRSFTSIDRQALASRILPGVPRRGLAIFMFIAGAVTLVVWLSDVLGGMLQGRPPQHLDSYTTMVTYVLDLGIITPGCFVTGALLLRRAPLGYLLGALLLGILVLLAPTIIAQTVSMVVAGISLTPGEIIGPTAGFTILGLVAIWLLYTFLRNIADEAPSSMKGNEQWESRFRPLA